jgi:hypothetical protein
VRAAIAVAVVLAAASAAASPASRDECGKAMARIKAWEGDTTPVSAGDMKQCLAQATAEQARCIIAAATKEAGKVCVGEGAAARAPAPAPVAADPLDGKPAPCRLVASAQKPLPAALAHALRASSDDVQPHQSLVVKSDGGGVRVFDPTDLGHVVVAPDAVGEAMLLPSRLVAVRDRSELVAAPAKGAPLRSVRKGYMLRSIDAVAAGGDVFVAGSDDRSQLFVDRLDAAGKLAAHHVVARGSLQSVRLARTAAGALAVVWLESDRARATTLWLSWCDRDGAPSKPLRVDGAAEQQAFANLTVAPHRGGIVVAWDPIVAAGEHEVVRVELRIFHADAGAAPTLLRRVPTTSMSWVVAGSAGGVLPNFVQALAFGRNAAIVWSTMTNERADLFGVAVDGGAPVSLVHELRAQPIARSDGKTATLLLEEPNAGHQSLTLRCE